MTQIVNRKLLAQEALAQKVDGTPEFKLAEQKARETALVEAPDDQTDRRQGQPQSGGGQDLHRRKPGDVRVA